ncbi:MAG: GNAT family N-acetyltransferase [Deltaproteobacteria bacterium]|nr:GNAT family N-acetyltransferase [Nannocystaceae bacterium]
MMNRAIARLQSDFLTPEQVAASYRVMGLDTQLIADQTYFLVELDGRLAGCGGWSFRATLFGGDDSIVEREPERLDPKRDAAKIRAMYTDPGFPRLGIGTKVVALCEAAARAHGFHRVELMATAAGVPLYRSLGYLSVGDLNEVDVDGTVVPLLRMHKTLDVNTSAAM